MQGANMNEYSFFDIQIFPEEEMALPVMLRECFKALHGLEPVQAKQVAIAFPLTKKTSLGNIIRLFAIEKNGLQQMKDQVEVLPLFRDYTRIGRMQSIALADVEAWQAFSRFRIPTKKSDRNNSLLHDRRKQEAMHLPYIYVESSSTDSTFMLRIKVTESTAAPNSFLVNSYGLGSCAHPCWLPKV